MDTFTLDDWDKHVEFAHLKSAVPNIDFHLHERCEIFFLLSGDVNYFVEKSIYPMASGDLVITNPVEIHKPTFASDAEYERIFIQFNPAFIAQFNASSCDLLNCFFQRPKGQANRIPLTKVESAELLLLLKKYEQQMTATVAVQPLKLAYLLEILVFLNERFDQQEKHLPSQSVHDKLLAVLEYIELHLTDELSLNVLERELFINRYYLSKLFKKHIGNTIHQYITYKRIAVAKTYLSEGRSVTEAREMSGFTDYTSFLKLFKRTVGVLPKNYRGYRITDDQNV